MTLSRDPFMVGLIAGAHEGMIVITADAVAKKIKFEIIRDVQSGKVPSTVKSYAELHNYVDANLYGGAEHLLNWSDIGATNDDEHCQAMNKVLAVLNPASDLVDDWIKAGGIKEAK